MRISDWSSDVCSSDLAAIDDRQLLTFDFGERRIPVEAAHADVMKAQSLFGHGIAIQLDRPGNRLDQLVLQFADPDERDLVDGDATALRRPHLGLGLKEARVLHAVARAEDVERLRSEERRVGTECVRTCRSRWAPAN